MLGDYHALDARYGALPARVSGTLPAFRAVCAGFPGLKEDDVRRCHLLNPDGAGDFVRRVRKQCR